LRGDFGKRDDIMEGDVLTLLFQEADEPFEMVRVRRRSHGAAPAEFPQDAGRPHQS
jgi:hypothetical protein